MDLLVTYWPWNQARHSEADYLGALEAASRYVTAIEAEVSVSIATSSDGHPSLDVKLPDVGDGQPVFDPTGPCSDEVVDLLRH